MSKQSPEDDAAMRAFIAGWFAHAASAAASAKGDAYALPEEAWDAYRLIDAQVTARILHPSHRWGQRPYLEREAPGSNRFRERKIPCCLNCLVDGLEDEWDAFQPCRRQDNPVAAPSHSKHPEHETADETAATEET